LYYLSRGVFLNRVLSKYAVWALAQKKEILEVKRNNGESGCEGCAQGPFDPSCSAF